MGATLPDDAGQALRAAVPGNDAGRQVRQSKPRVRRCHAQVACQRKLKSLVYGVAANEGDGWLLDGGNGFAHTQAREIVRHRGIARELCANAEIAVTRAISSNDAHTHIVVLPNALACVTQKLRRLLVDGVARIGTGQRDGCDMVLNRQVHDPEW